MVDEEIAGPGVGRIVQSQSSAQRVAGRKGNVAEHGQVSGPTHHARECDVALLGFPSATIVIPHVDDGISADIDRTAVGLIGSASRESAATERKRIGHGARRGIIVIESSTRIHSNVGPLAYDTEGVDAQDFQVAAVNGEIGGVAAVEGAVSGDGDSHFTTSSFGHVLFPLQSTGEGEDGSCIGYIPSLRGNSTTETKRGGNDDSSRATSGDFDPVCGYLRSHFKAIGSHRTRGDGDGGWRGGASFKGQRVDLDVLLKRGGERCSSDAIVGKDNVRAAARNGGRRRGARLVGGPVVGIGIPGGVRQTSPVGIACDERSGGQLDEIVRHVPSESREAARSGPLNDVAGAKGCEPPIR